MVDFSQDAHSDHAGRGSDWHAFVQAKRGDIKPILLAVLKERPMHGYEIIRYLEEKSHGMWRPSAGSVYPKLQQLEEDGLITPHDEGDKRIYSLTAKGQEAAQQKLQVPWDVDEKTLDHIIRLRSLSFHAVGLLKQIIHSRDEAKIQQAQRAIEAMNRDLENIAKTAQPKEEQ